MSTKELAVGPVTGELVEEVNPMKIHEGKRTIRVDLKPDLNGNIKSVTFGFDPTDEVSREQALSDAVRYRDNRILLSLNTNTGYDGIKVGKFDGNIYVYVYFKFKGNQYKGDNDTDIVLSSEMPYKKALDTAIAYICRIKGYNVPSIINYDYGTAAAYELGYKGHPLDIAKEDAAKQIKILDKIIDPKTNDEGVVSRIIDDVTIVGEFKTGDRWRIITNSKLFASRLEAHANTIIKLTEKMEDDGVSEHVKSELEEEIHRLNGKSDLMYSRATNNAALPVTNEERIKVIEKHRNIGLITIAPVSKLSFSKKLAERNKLS